MTKQRAFLGHLCLSAIVVSGVCAAIFLFWYPSPYFEAKGAWNVLRVLLGVDLVVGPLLTLFLYKPNKPGLKIDMTFIAVVQLSALVYGTTVIFAERPYFAVFAVDRFEVISRREVDLGEIQHPALLDKPLVGPILTVALRPDTPEGMQELLDDVIFLGKPDIERQPKYWQPYAEQTPHVLEKVTALDQLLDARPESRQAIEDLLAESDREIDDLGFFPLVGQERDFAFLVDKRTGTPFDIVDVDPWLN